MQQIDREASTVTNRSLTLELLWSHSKTCILQSC